MGRMLDSFQQGRSPRPVAETPLPALHTVWPDDDTEDDIPYIEVGGPKGVKSEIGTLKSEAKAAPAVAELKKEWMTVRFRPVAVTPAWSPSSARFAPELIAFHQPDHPSSLQYRELATSLLAQTPTEQPRVLLFTGSTAGAGTTTVLLNTALTLARDNLLRVAVVDANLRRAAVATRLGSPDGAGLRDVLTNRVPVEAALRTTGLPGLTVLGAGQDESVHPTRLAGENMRAVLRQLRERHDLVIVDGPCWDGRPEVVALGCACDAVYLCLPEQQEHAPQTADLLQLIPEQGASLRGCILTHQ